MQISTTAKFNKTDLVKTIKAFPAQIRRDSEGILRQEGRSFAKELARFTLPIGLGDAAWKKLAYKISGDIRRALMSPRRLYDFLKNNVSKSFADEVWALIHGGGKKRGRVLARMLRAVPAPVAGLAITSAVPGAQIRAARTGEWGGIPKDVAPVGIVIDEQAIQRFISKMQRRIGFAKGGWAAAGQSISGRNVKGIPQWASYGRHKSPGKGVYLKDRNSIRLTNDVNYSRKALPDAGEERAKFNAARNLHLSLLHAVNAIAAKHFARGQKAA